MHQVMNLPSKSELMEPIIAALRILGGEATVAVIDAKVAEILKLSKETLEYEDDNTPGTAFCYRMRWARTALKHKGILLNPSRGYWVINQEIENKVWERR